jgi:hypothetical protein
MNKKTNHISRGTVNSLLALVLILTGIMGVKFLRHAIIINQGETIAQLALVDPKSAEFMDSELVNRFGSPAYVCGSVNARNRMGGYVGFHRFIVDLIDKKAYFESPAAGIDQDQIDFLSLYSQTCLSINRF